MKLVTVNTTLPKSNTVLHKIDFTPMWHYQLNLIQITYSIIEKHGLNQVLSNLDI